MTERPTERSQSDRAGTPGAHDAPGSWICCRGHHRRQRLFCVAVVQHISRSRGGRHIGSTPDAHTAALTGTVLLIDIRRPDEWERTGVGEAAVPLDMRRSDFIDALLARTKGRRDVPVALICARGVRSRRMTERLTEAGFSTIIDVPEGMLGSGAGPGWLKRGLPTVNWVPK